MALQYAAYGAISAFIGTVLYANLPTRYTLGAVVPTVKYLADAPLKKIETEKDVLSAPMIKAGSLFAEKPLLVMAVRRPGCAFCRHQAQLLGEIADELDNSGVRMIAVLHEAMGAEEFHNFFKGDLYFDAKKYFFGPEQRWLPLWMGAMRLSSYINAYRTKKAQVKGNFDGEGRLLGGVYLINKDEMVFSHLEQNWGDQVETKQVLEAVKNL